MSTDAVAIGLAVALGLVATVSASVLLSRLIARRAERLVPPLGRITRVDGTRLHWVERGEGRPVILVHGLLTQMRSLTHPLLDDLARDFHVLAIDRPGSGWSDPRPDGRVGLRADADTLAAFIRERALDRPLIVGHSLGGAVALATAVHHPDRVGGLALVTPLTRILDEPPEVFRALRVHSPLLRRIIGSCIAAPLSLLMERSVQRDVFAPDPVPDAFAIRGGSVLARRPEAFIDASTDMVSVPDHLPEVEAAYPTLDLPVAILAADDDRVLPTEIHGLPMRDRVPGATVEVVEGGHMLPLTRPERVAAFVREAAARTWAAR